MTNIRIDKILGSRRLSNYFWASIILLGGIGFLLVGLSSYLKKQIIPLTYSIDISFLPQGIIMTFYGTIGVLISLFLWYTIILDIGSGYNEFNNEAGIVTIFRLGFPGKNRILNLKYSIKDIYSIKINIIEGLSPKKEIYLSMKDKREIPLTKVGQPISINNIEKQASILAKFLGVILEGI
uniref:Photosystem I assembly protein Ycf4 n=1 Tax=Acrosorium ciliolatum TaxID=1550622 RepID=A0A1Z1M1L6_9FLOR|nr:photosystem I assembly protein [Acrosorium ciliolatum]ARW59978.1 photosystem I assembly protein [Acrosorium ciliolatum]